jgi:sarcosine oxidase
MPGHAPKDEASGLPERKSYDCVVVGAGSFGVWSALRLRESGRTVALADAHGAGNPLSSSGGASRIIRMGYGADEVYTRWARRSLECWKDVFARVGRPELFQPTGILWTARPGHKHAANSLAVFERLAIPHESLNTAELRRRFPLIRCEDGTLGIYEPDSGVLLANQAVRAVAQEAQRKGVEFLAERVIPGKARFDAGETVYACGPWLPTLFPDVVGARIEVTRQPLFYFDAPSAQMPAWIDFSDPRGTYSVPPVDGKGFKLGLDRHGAAFDPERGSRETTAAEEEEARAVLSERFPSLAGVPLAGTEVCQYESTCNGDFLIDRHPDLPHVWLVGGGSGHGFKQGPAVGEYVTGLVNGAAPDDRFALCTKSVDFKRAVY